MRKHGETNVGKYKSGNQNWTRLYRAWHHFNDIKDIPVCSEWAGSFEAFRDWANANGYDEENGYVYFRRKDRDIGWCPENVIITAIVPHSRIFLTHNGMTMSMTDWSKHIGISKQLLWMRINKLKWSVEKALSEKENESYESELDFR